ncbi:MAG: OmpA family protein [Bacteroidia bacterium]|nr:OmpA family protein [Bacteroidia bacterium]
MKNFLLWLLLFILLLWTLLGTIWYKNTCCDCCSLKASHPLVITDGPETVVRANDNVRFDMNGAAPGIGAEVRDAYGQLADYLKKNPGKTLTITGRYSENETAPSGFENMGLARADAIKKYLIQTGIPEKQLKTAAVLDKALFADGKSVFGGMGYDFSNAANVPDSAAVAKLLSEKTNSGDKSRSDAISVTPFTLYFGTNNNKIELSQEQTQLFVQMIQFLSQSPESKVNISGHTDNVGKEASNKALSLKRAEFAKKFFISKGIPQNRIMVEGLGSSKPVADNSTEEGRARNRRTEVSVK